MLEPGDPELERRVQGQAADLDWTVEMGPKTPLSGGAASLRAAERLGDDRNARVVVWLDPAGDGWIVNVVDVERGRLLVREVKPEGSVDDLGRSATLEAAALVVRSALRSLAEGGEIGVVPSGAETASNPTGNESAAAAPLARPVTKGPSGDTVGGIDPPGSKGERESFVAVEAGWRAVWATAGGVPYQGATLQLGWIGLRWFAALGGTWGLPATLQAREARLDIRRHQVAVRTGPRFALSNDWLVSTGLGAGLVAFDRRTVHTAMPFQKTAGATSLSAAIGLAIALHWTPSRHLGLVGSLGADVVPRAPRFAVEDTAGPTEIGRGWPVQFGISLAAEIRTGPL